MHLCPVLGGIAVPLIEVRSFDEKPDGQHVLLEREDYIGDRNGGQYMGIRTDHGDGSNDCTAFAETAVIKLV